MEMLVCMHMGDFLYVVSRFREGYIVVQSKLRRSDDDGESGCVAFFVFCSHRSHYLALLAGWDMMRTV